MKPKIKKFPTSVVLSMVSGTLYCDSIADVQNCLEWAYGCPLLTHQMASYRIFEDTQKLFPEITADYSKLYDNEASSTEILAFFENNYPYEIDVIHGSANNEA